MMFKKKYWAILLFLIIGAITISQASAVDINATDEIASDVVDEEIMTNLAGEEISSDSNNKNVIASDVGSEEIAISNDTGAVSVNGYGTFTELNNLIANAGTSLTLTKDYMYDPDVDNHDSLKLGLDLKNDILIYGNGHTIYGNGARIMWIYSSKVVYIENLNFENPYSSSDFFNDSVDRQSSGGAIYNNGILFLEGCTFKGNIAENGGAIYCTRSSILYLTKCNFTLNFADYNGGAIYNNGISYIIGSSGSTGDYCWFMGNLAASKGGAIYSSYELSVTNSAFAINLAPNGGAVYNVNCSYIEDSIFMNNSATSYGGATYDVIVADSLFSNNDAKGNAYGHDMYKGVNINCKGKTASGNYAKIETISNRIKDVISTTELTTKSDTLQYSTLTGNQFKVVVTSKSGNDKIKGVKVKLSLDTGENYTAISDANGEVSFSLPTLTYGTHKYIVKLTDLSTEKTYSVSVSQGRTTVVFNKDKIKFNYGKSGSVGVNVVGGTIKSSSDISVLGYDGNPSISLSTNNVITISGLPVGSYTLSVKTTPNDGYTSSTATIPITVVKPTAKITASKLTTTYKSGKKFSVTLKDTTNNKPLSGVKVNFRVYTGSSYNDYKISTNSNGVATFSSASKLNPGKHKVVLSYSNSRYTCKSVTTYIVVNKKTLTISATPKKYRDCGEVHIRVSEGSKPLNGIKVNLKVYTGGSYKQYNLITGFDGKKYFTNGWVLISSNAFSAGTHVVKISIISSYYKGTAKSYLIIPSSIKKAKYTGVMSNGRTYKV